MDDRNEILAAIRDAGGNITDAAKSLGVARRTLQNRMRKYGIAEGKSGRPPRKLRHAKRNRTAASGLAAAAMLVGGALIGAKMKSES